MPKAEEDLAYWKATGNKRIMKRITKLLEDILQHPFTGIGKPEPLKGDLQALLMSTDWCTPSVMVWFTYMFFLCAIIIQNSIGSIS